MYIHNTTSIAFISYNFFFLVGVEVWHDRNGKFSEYCRVSFVTLRKLSAPANDDEMTKTHHALLKELREISQVGEKPNTSFSILMIRGLRFVLQQI